MLKHCNYVVFQLVQDFVHQQNGNGSCPCRSNWILEQILRQNEITGGDTKRISVILRKGKVNLPAEFLL